MILVESLSPLLLPSQLRYQWNRVLIDAAERQGRGINFCGEYFLGRRRVFDVQMALCELHQHLNNSVISVRENVLGIMPMPFSVESPPDRISSPLPNILEDQAAARTIGFKAGWCQAGPARLLQLGAGGFRLSVSSICLFDRGSGLFLCSSCLIKRDDSQEPSGDQLQYVETRVKVVGRLHQRKLDWINHLLARRLGPVGGLDNKDECFRPHGRLDSVFQVHCYPREVNGHCVLGLVGPMGQRRGCTSGYRVEPVAAPHIFVQSLVDIGVGVATQLYPGKKLDHKCLLAMAPISLSLQRLHFVEQLRTVIADIANGSVGLVNDQVAAAR